MDNKELEELIREIEKVDFVSWKNHPMTKLVCNYIAVIAEEAKQQWTDILFSDDELNVDSLMHQKMIIRYNIYKEFVDLDLDSIKQNFNQLLISQNDNNKK
jgi:predicted nucleotide-binding protein (sugar kinase/HSP70/actin superfamily)